MAISNARVSSCPTCRPCTPFPHPVFPPLLSCLPSMHRPWRPRAARARQPQQPRPHGAQQHVHGMSGRCPQKWELRTEFISCVNLSPHLDPHCSPCPRDLPHFLAPHQAKKVAVLTSAAVSCGRARVLDQGPDMRWRGLQAWLPSSRAPWLRHGPFLPFTSGPSSGWTPNPPCLPKPLNSGAPWGKPPAQIGRHRAAPRALPSAPNPAPWTLRRAQRPWPP